MLQLASAEASAIVTRCRGIEVSSARVRVRTEAEIPRDTPPRVTYQRSASPKHGRGEFRVTVVGPVLGSMDSTELGLGATCAGSGVKFQATVLRSAAYTGGVLKYGTWRPEIDVVLTARPGATLGALWKIVLTTGGEVRKSDLPGGPNTIFPVLVTTVLR